MRVLPSLVALLSLALLESKVAHAQTLDSRNLAKQKPFTMPSTGVQMAAETQSVGEERKSAILPSDAATNRTDVLTTAKEEPSETNASSVSPLNASMTSSNTITMTLGEALEFGLVFDAVLFTVLFVVTAPLFVH